MSTLKSLGRLVRVWHCETVSMFYHSFFYRRVQLERIIMMPVLHVPLTISVKNGALKEVGEKGRTVGSIDTSFVTEGTTDVK